MNDTAPPLPRRVQGQTPSPLLSFSIFVLPIPSIPFPDVQEQRRYDETFKGNGPIIYFYEAYVKPLNLISPWPLTLHCEHQHSMVEFAFLSTGNIERFTRNLSLRKQQLKLGMDYSYCEDGIHNQPIMVLQSTFSFAKSKVCFGAVAGP